MINTFITYIRLYFVLRGAEFKRRLANPFDFFIFIFCDVLIQAVGIVFVTVLFRNIPPVNGWDYSGVLLLYAFFQLSYGLFSFLFWPLYDFGYVLVSGEFDKVLMRPISSLFQLICRGIGDIGGLVTGISILIYLCFNEAISLDASQIVLLILLLICNVILYICIYTLIASTSFWMENASRSLFTILDISSSYAKYPFIIFPKFIKMFLTWIVPLGFMGYYPAAYVTENLDGNYIYYLPLLLMILLIVTITIWRYGLKKYRGVGN